MNMQRKPVKFVRGFTLAELLIVIVIIAILAAITVVVYAQIQNRAKTASGQSLSSQIAQKARLYSTTNNRIPTYSELVSNNGSAGKESQIATPSQILDATQSGNNPLTAELADKGKRILYVSSAEYHDGTCGDTSRTVDNTYVVYWDYVQNQQIAVPIGPEARKGPIGTNYVSTGTMTSGCA